MLILLKVIFNMVHKISIYRSHIEGKNVLGYAQLAVFDLADDVYFPIRLFDFWTLENKDFLIPANKYNCRLTFSPKFHKVLPLVLDVPGRQGIRIHAGNTYKDSTGCILVGEKTSTFFIDKPSAPLINSKKTLDTLISHLPKCSFELFIFDDLSLRCSK